MDNLKCIHCDRHFQHRRDLQRHLRSLHGNEHYDCEHCGSSFNRKSNLARHLTKCMNKRSLEDDDMITPMKRIKSAEITSSISVKPSECNWCGHKKKLVDHKPYCFDCSVNGRDCRQCHRPLPERFYSRDINNCDACVSKREKYLIKGGRKVSLGSVVETKEVLPSDNNKHDPLIFFAENKKCITDFLENRIGENQGIKWSLTIKVKFTKVTDIGCENTSTPHFVDDVYVSTTQNVEEQLSDAFQQLEKKIVILNGKEVVGY